MTLKSKNRPDDKLSNLPADDRSRLDGWLKIHPYREVVRLAALPRPDGLALNTSTRALSVYYHKYLGPNPIDDLARVIQAHPHAADQAAAAFLQTKALELASGKMTLSAFNAIARYEFRRQNLELTRKAQALGTLRDAFAFQTPP